MVTGPGYRAACSARPRLAPSDQVGMLNQKVVVPAEDVAPT